MTSEVAVFDVNKGSLIEPFQNSDQMPNDKEDHRLTEMLAGTGSIKYEDFKLKMLIGKGTFGKVYLAELKERLFAIKIIRKDVLIEYN
jgi:serine/threonine protein kinase